jgi:hypothetical protein
MLHELFISAKDTNELRTCSTCNQLLPHSKFYKDGTDPEGNTKFRRDCKDCYKTKRMHEAKLKAKSKGAKQHERPRDQVRRRKSN